MLRLLDCDVEPREPAGVWDYISPSRLNLWLRCPLAFKLRYIDGIVEPASPNLLLGKMVHFGLELFYRHLQLGVILDAEAIATRMMADWDEAATQDDAQFASVADENALKRQAVSLVTCYRSQVDEREDSPLAVESRLEAPLVDPDTGADLGIPLLGVIDLVSDADNGSLIVDFKTTSRGGKPPDVIHEIQMTSYAYLFRHASRQTETALEIRGLVKTKSPRIEFHRYEARTDVHFRRLFAVIRAYLDDLDSGRFAFRPGLGCHMCEFRETHCRDWSV